MGVALSVVFFVLAYLSPGELFPELGQYRIQMWFALPAIAFAVINMITSPSKTKMPQAYLLVGMFFAVGFSRFANRFVGASLSAVLEFAVPAASLYLVLLNFNSLKSLRFLTIALVMTGIYFVCVGTFDLLTTAGETPAVMYAPVYSMDGSFEYVRRIRGLGILADPNDLAQYLLILMACLGVAWRRNGLYRLLFVILPGLFLFAGVALTRSRGGLLGLAAMFALALMDKIGKVKSMIFSGVCVIGLLALNFSGNRAISLTGGQDRLDIWRDAWGFVKISPLWGVGYGWFTRPMFGGTRLEHTAHNSFILCLTELGLIGLFFWIGLIVCSFTQLNAMVRLEAKTDNQRELQTWAKAMRVALGTFLVTGWFLSRTYTITFYLLIGIIACLAAMMRDETDAQALKVTPKWLASTLLAEVGCVLLIFLTLKLRNLAL